MNILNARGWIGDRIAAWAEESRFGYLADMAFGWSGMSRHDRWWWATARSLADVGGLTVNWLYGDLYQTPGHCGPPCDETIPHLDVLAACNLAGFVTTNSQSASSPQEAERYGDEWEAWADGFVSDNTLQRLQAAVTGTPLLLAGARGRQQFGESRYNLRRVWRDEVSFYEDRCPGAADEIRSAWFVTVADPQPGTNARLWAALAAFAESAPDPLPVTRDPRRHGEGSTSPSCSPLHRRHVMKRNLAMSAAFLAAGLLSLLAGEWSAAIVGTSALARAYGILVALGTLAFITQGPVFEWLGFAEYAEEETA